MSLTYKPSTAYMIPKNTAVETTLYGLDLEFIFNGYTLNRLFYSTYYRDENGVWAYINEEKPITLDRVYYNQEIVKAKLLNDTFGAYVNSECGWSVNVLGEQKNLVESTDSLYINEYNGVESGDSFYCENAIKKFSRNTDLKVLLDNESAINKKYSIEKISENIVNVGDSITTNTANKFNFYAMFTRVENSLYEDFAFLKDVVYKMTIDYPLNKTYVEDIEEYVGLDFSFSFNSTVPVTIVSENKKVGETNVSYTVEFSFSENQLAPIPINLSLFPMEDNVDIMIPTNQVFLYFVEYDTVDTNDVFAEIVRSNIRWHYNREGAIQSSDDDIVYYDVMGTNSVSPMSRSQIIPFIPIKTTVMSIVVPSVLDSINYVFKPTWSSYVPTIEKWSAKIYTSGGLLLDETAEIYNANVSKEFYTSISNGVSYYVEFDCVDTNGYNYYAKSNIFKAEYDVIDAFYSPTATFDCKTTKTDINWDGLISIKQELSGTGEYVDDFISVGNNGYKLNGGSFLTYFLDIPNQEPPSFLFNPNNDIFDGDVVSLENDNGDYAKIIYSRDDGEFYLSLYEQNTGYSYNEIISVYPNITSQDYFLVGYYQSNGYVRKLEV